MRARVSSLWLARTGCGPTEYQDAFCPRVDGERSGPRLRFALADGAGYSRSAMEPCPPEGLKRVALHATRL